MNIVLLGPQGSGKGTQAQRLAENYGLAHIATGDMIRQMKELDTPAGRELKEVYDRGDLVSDDLMIRLIRERLDRGDTDARRRPRRLPAHAAAGGGARRGAGRSRPQPRRRVRAEGAGPRAAAGTPAEARAAEENRTDDTPEAIQRRLDTYDRETAPLVEYYRTSRGNVVGIHADRSIGEVFHEIQEALSAVEARA